MYLIELVPPFIAIFRAHHDQVLTVISASQVL